MEYEVIILDATEPEIERTKKQKRYYSGKKKKHTIKTEIIINKNTKAVICTQFSKGRQRDFKVFKESKTKINPEIEILADRGYQGVRKIHRTYAKVKVGERSSRRM